MDNLYAPPGTSSYRIRVHKNTNESEQSSYKGIPVVLSSVVNGLVSGMAVELAVE